MVVDLVAAEVVMEVIFHIFSDFPSKFSEMFFIQTGGGMGGGGGGYGGGGSSGGGGGYGGSSGGGGGYGGNSNLSKTFLSKIF